jgi:hypothetical protein
MRRHYESLNYVDAAPDLTCFRFTRTQGSDAGFISYTPYEDAGYEGPDITLRRIQVERLRNMCNEILEDWK